MKIPDKIYLQIKDDSGEDQNEITWCEDRVEDTDIVYIRADIPDELKGIIPQQDE